MSIFKKSALVALALFSLSGQANAAVITETIDWTASNFTSAFNPSFTPPVDPVYGSLTLTFDPSEPYASQTSGIWLNSLNIPSNSGYPLQFNYLSPNSTDTLVVGNHLLFGECTVFCGANTWTLSVSGLGTPNPALLEMAYSTINGAFNTSTGSLTIIPGVVPLPASLPMFAAAIIGLGALAFRRKRLEAVA